MRSTSINHNKFGHWNIALRMQLRHNQNKERLQKLLNSSAMWWSWGYSFPSFFSFGKIWANTVTFRNLSLHKDALRET